MKELLEPNAFILYIIICSYNEDSFVKIGRTRNIYNRIKNIQTGCPHEISNIFVITSEFEYEEEIIGLEGVIHKLIDKYQMKGEWYLATEEFFQIFSKLLERINNSDLSDYVFEDEELFSLDEVEILFHSHNYIIYELIMPIKPNQIVKGRKILDSIEIYTSIKNLELNV
ncbi:GIY-YIG nuclease family protein [Paenibacillus xylanivorans]|uniref:GIY-YIG nuclease family protein n=1 Tax=Paenibacillus xylanivorans TaxID=1705561 RepID=A0A0M9BQK1_9BACL|nr:GIY-YIG nuclease family protein [Paenibacillus xylanivorans]KOY16789.1 hypothetical protein AMS66_07865 [Paenibacillus xylanivorans]